MHVYRWDLDRTYLETEIHSVRGLVRAAFETAAQKRTVPGASALIRALVAHDPAARICVLSGSPTQMRAVIEQKLALDGIPVDHLILKDNLGNLRRGRLRAVRGQIGYKLPHLLEARVGLGADVGETLFGDDSESDALIYAAYAAAINGELDADALTRILRAARAYPDTIDQALAALGRLGAADAVEDIFIRVDRGAPLAKLRRLGPRVIPVFSWFQAALVLHRRGRLSVAGLVDVAHACSLSGLDPQSFAGLVQDAARRGLVEPDTLQVVLADPGLDPIRSATLASLDRLGRPPRPDTPDPRPDLAALLEVIGTL